MTNNNLANSDSTRSGSGNVPYTVTTGNIVVTNGVELNVAFQFCSNKIRFINQRQHNSQCIEMQKMIECALTATRSQTEEMTNMCMICNGSRQYFDRTGEGFENHVKGKHNMWKYMFLIMYLRNKNMTEMTGQETRVWNAIKDVWSPKFDWLHFQSVSTAGSLRHVETLAAESASGKAPGRSASHSKKAGALDSHDVSHLRVSASDTAPEVHSSTALTTAPVAIAADTEAILSAIETRMHAVLERLQLQHRQALEEQMVGVALIPNLTTALRTVSDPFYT